MVGNLEFFRVVLVTLGLLSFGSYSQENGKDTLKADLEDKQDVGSKKDGGKKVGTTEGQNSTKEAPQMADEVEWERPFNFFAAAGASAMFGDHYSVAISPVDNSVQFEKTFPILTRFSLGLVWNPIPEKGEGYVESFFKNKRILPAYQAGRKHLAVALLVNIFQLSYSDAFSASSPIDVGFGAGYRNSNFLILGTLEFTPLKTPRRYFVEQYKDKNLPLVLAGSLEPVRTVSTDDDKLFVNRIFPSIGIKIAYSFTKQK